MPAQNALRSKVRPAGQRGGAGHAQASLKGCWSTPEPAPNRSTRCADEVPSRHIGLWKPRHRKTASKPLAASRERSPHDRVNWLTRTTGNSARIWRRVRILQVGSPAQVVEALARRCRRFRPQDPHCQPRNCQARARTRKRSCSSPSTSTSQARRANAACGRPSRARRAGRSSRSRPSEDRAACAPTSRRQDPAGRRHPPYRPASPHSGPQALPRRESSKGGRCARDP